MSDPSYQRALSHLHQMLGDGAEFRPGQWEAIEKVAIHKQRALVVQPTGWGKSLVYFIATRLLRDEGKGLTLLVSPLLSLMRNQIAMAKRIGIRAYTINSNNEEEWPSVERALWQDACDVLLIAPERLANHKFQNLLTNVIRGRIGLFVVDEAHCISDWGHDFRPDYRRIVRILKALPPNVPVLGTTATANDRVLTDIREQLGEDLLILRGPLARKSLYLQNIVLHNQSERLAWLAENLPRLPGSGIVYCLTVPDTEQVAAWLKSQGIAAEAYHSRSEKREELEQRFLRNEIKVLVATVALGMGFDKSDVGFVIHYQRPGSPIAYYQQIGRAGRSLDHAYCILLTGDEDEDIQDYFIESAFPPVHVFNQVHQTLAQNSGLSLNQLMAKINVSKGMLEKTLKILEVEGHIGRLNGHNSSYFARSQTLNLDTERIERITQLRRHEQTQMREYIYHQGCLMAFLQQALDDPYAEPCGHCAQCRGEGLPTSVSTDLVLKAEDFLKHEIILLPPRKQLPPGLVPDLSFLSSSYQNATGRALCRYGRVGWGRLVRSGKYEEGRFADELVEAAAQLIKEVWNPNPFPQWVTAIPSRRRPHLVPDFAQRLAQRLGLPFYPVLERIADAPPQKDMQNNYMQAKNVLNTIKISGKVLPGPVLLVDDVFDSGWTMTIAGYLLRKNGSGIVYPFALAQATARNT
ncbi:MAG: RecQ family ATP-dependent DNA helicase [Thermanaerothrix sp.]|jgi:ATP-dependent DNA helicase RecQ|uniref:DNA 3'-5' helicase n=1 Tax=Thermanaerothrix solaris TaxID=3058434 RepID=A0ABU3NN92_9CHLR|nr:RecQ family ATP-dependent DNA helicase [Thermanaerothrix sp. 4228-RoL]MDT8898314.1 RecQ family ATP-dependent DNA helicase [Thermanaerothrix sp. 4228-RoL]